MKYLQCFIDIDKEFSKNKQKHNLTQVCIIPNFVLNFLVILFHEDEELLSIKTQNITFISFDWDFSVLNIYCIRNCVECSEIIYIERMKY